MIGNFGVPVARRKEEKLNMPIASGPATVLLSGLKMKLPIHRSGTQ